MSIVYTCNTFCVIHQSMQCIQVRSMFSCYILVMNAIIYSRFTTILWDTTETKTLAIVFKYWRENAPYKLHIANTIINVYTIFYIGVHPYFKQYNYKCVFMSCQSTLIQCDLELYGASLIPFKVRCEHRNRRLRISRKRGEQKVIVGLKFSHHHKGMLQCDIELNVQCVFNSCESMWCINIVYVHVLRTHCQM